MKRLIAFLLTLPLLLCCAACGKNYDHTTKPTDSTENQPTKSTDPSEDIPTESTEASEDTSTEPSADTAPPVSQPVENTALTIGKYPISYTELDYYYIDAINHYCRSYKDYLSYLIDTTRSIGEQLLDKDTGKTWADNFLEMAIWQAHYNYAIYDAAKTADFELPQEEADALRALFDSMQTHAESMGFSNTTAYLQSIYGERADENSYRNYYEIAVIANSYYAHHAEDLRNSFTKDDLRAYEADQQYAYNSYTYASFYLSVDGFKGNEHDGEAEDILLKAAQILSQPAHNTVEKLNDAIARMEIAWNEFKDVSITDLPLEKYEHIQFSTATEYHNVLYSRINGVVQEWLRDDSRMNGDITAIPYITTTLDDDGKEITTLKGYYIVLFQGVNDNSFPLANVRHILVAFQSESGNEYGYPSYTDAQKEAAKKQAELLLEQWKNGEATEASFAALANEHSDDGDGTTGGLYENVYPGQMVTNFNDWCFDESRQPGDVGLIETEYGYHIMYYVSHSDENYRDYMLANEKLYEEIDAWQTTLKDAMTIQEKDITKINRDLIIDNILY